MFFFFLLATNMLRAQHHVMGSLVGALPTHPRQNSVPGLPLLLMPEETTLLVEESQSLEYTVTLYSLSRHRSPLGVVGSLQPLLTLNDKSPLIPEPKANL